MTEIVPVLDFPIETKQFVEQGLGIELSEGTAIGFANKSEGLVAGVVYHNFERSAGVIEISAYSSRRDWLTKSSLKKIFGFPFEELGARLAVARISEFNTRARRIWRALGAKEYLIPEIRGEGEGEAVFVLNGNEFMKSKFMGVA